MEKRSFMRVDEVAAELGVSKSYAYKIVQRHLRYIWEHRKALYTGLFLDGKLNSYLVDLNGKAEDMFFQLVKELDEKEGITETLKAADQME